MIPPDLCAGNDLCSGASNEGDIFLTCDDCTVAIKWMQDFAGDWISFCPLGCPAILSADMNCDGETNGADIQRFVELLVSGPFTCQADMNDDHALDVDDVSAFVSALLGA